MATKRCEACAEKIQQAAKICKHCGAEQPAYVEPPVASGWLLPVLTAVALFAIPIGFVLLGQNSPPKPVAAYSPFSSLYECQDTTRRIATVWYFTRAYPVIDQRGKVMICGYTASGDLRFYTPQRDSLNEGSTEEYRETCQTAAKLCEVTMTER